MSRLIILLFTLFTLAFGSALAQDQETEVVVQPTATGPDLYAGGALSIGFPGAQGVSVTAFGLSGYFGARDLITENLDVRGSLSFGFGSVASIGYTLFRFAADGIYNFSLDADVPIAPYVGGGLRYGRLSSMGYGAGGVGIGFLGGARYPFSPQVSGFAELNFDVYFGSPSVTYPAFAVGVNFDF